MTRKSAQYVMVPWKKKQSSLIFAIKAVIDALLQSDTIPIREISVPVLPFFRHNARA